MHGVQAYWTASGRIYWRIINRIISNLPTKTSSISCWLARMRYFRNSSTLCRSSGEMLASSHPLFTTPPPTSPGSFQHSRERRLFESGSEQRTPTGSRHIGMSRRNSCAALVRTLRIYPCRSRQFKQQLGGLFFRHKESPE